MIPNIWITSHRVRVTKGSLIVGNLPSQCYMLHWWCFLKLLWARIRCKKEGNQVNAWLSHKKYRFGDSYGNSEKVLVTAVGAPQVGAAWIGRYSLKMHMTSWPLVKFQIYRSVSITELSLWIWRNCLRAISPASLFVHFTSQSGAISCLSNKFLNNLGEWQLNSGQICLVTDGMPRSQLTLW